ncbi:MAG: type II toxin-antitoxin system VapC family toxin [Cyclobacteriaceae bacterium]|nr:type II toxin-antitoxin system VapC family toxin [Cyclobacteriaceae bacterium]
MIIADTNLISYLYFETIHSELANEVHKFDAEWACPTLWRSEFVNVVSHYLRRKIINHQDGLDVIDFAQHTVGEREFTVSSYAVFELVSKSDCSSYDCEFVALAIELQSQLVTFDKKILKEFSGVAIHPNDFLLEKKK